MIEILLLIAALGGIASFARGRGVSPVAVGAVVLGGFVVIRLASMMLAITDDFRLALATAAWAWVGLVASFVRFVIGAGRPRPTRSWACKSCLYTNGRHAVVCEACGQPWKTTDAALGPTRT